MSSNITDSTRVSLKLTLGIATGLIVPGLGVLWWLASSIMGQGAASNLALQAIHAEIRMMRSDLSAHVNSGGHADALSRFDFQNFCESLRMANDDVIVPQMRFGD